MWSQRLLSCPVSGRRIPLTLVTQLAGEKFARALPVAPSAAQDDLPAKALAPRQAFRPAPRRRRPVGRRAPESAKGSCPQARIAKKGLTVTPPRHGTHWVSCLVPQKRVQN